MKITNVMTVDRGNFEVVLKTDVVEIVHGMRWLKCRGVIIKL
jgi:hypothetical protein